MSVETEVAEVIASYETEVAELVGGYGEQIDKLVSDIEAAGGIDALSEYFYEASDELKGDLGSKAARCLERRSDQEAAISSVEDWVAENVANGGTKANVLCDFVMNGPQEAAARIHDEIVRIAGGPKAP